MESFSTEILETINKKNKSDALHDLEIREYNLKLLINHSTAIKQYEPETDEYDFIQNECKNIIDSVKRWLKLEGLL